MQFPTSRQLLQVLEIAVICLTVVVTHAHGQEPLVQTLTAPPPPKVIPSEERTQIDGAKDMKARVKLTLELAETHLVSAEAQTTQGNFEGASRAVGQYHALIDDVLRFLASQKLDSNKTRDLYKRIELALRAHGPRLTAMRRTTPLEYAVWIKEVEEFARRGRTEALNSFYGHTVVHEQQNSNNEKPDDQPRKNNSLVPDKKQP